MRVDGHPLSIADRAILRRFASPVRADGPKTVRQNVVVQSNSDESIVSEERADGLKDPQSGVLVQSLIDGCMPSPEGVDGSDKGASVRSELVAKSGLLVVTETATSLQQYFWTARLSFPHCTPPHAVRHAPRTTSTRRHLFCLRLAQTRTENIMMDHLAKIAGQQREATAVPELQNTRLRLCSSQFLQPSTVQILIHWPKPTTSTLWEYF